MVSYRDGQPSDELRRLQAVQQDLAVRFVSYCHEEGLSPFLAAGSALGAWRDGGMIPWDDDIDFGMIRPEYDALIARFASRPIPGVVLQCSRTTPDYPYTFAKLRLEGTSVKEHLSLGPGFHSGIFIDVFPYDAVPRGRVLRGVHYAMLTFCNYFVLSFNRQLAFGATRPLFRWLRLLAFAARPVLPINAIAALREWTLRKAWSGGFDRVASFHMYGLRDAGKTVTQLGVLTPPRMMPFGQDHLPVPADCEAYLEAVFGDYWQLPPPDLRRPSHIAEVDFGDK